MNITKQTCFKKMMKDKELTSFIQQKSFDPWKGTMFEGYVHLTPRQKGLFGEKFVAKFMEQKGFHVTQSLTTGHDMLINKMKTEIKFSLATRKTSTQTAPTLRSSPKKRGDIITTIDKDKFIMNHVSKQKDWDRLIFIGVNSMNDISLLWFNKKDFIKYVNKKDHVFNNQQGGDSLQNDDYMCTKISKLRECSFVHTTIKDF